MNICLQTGKRAHSKIIMLFSENNNWNDSGSGSFLEIYGHLSLLTHCSK